MSATPERVVVCWIPDWPIHASLCEQATIDAETPDPHTTPIALLAKHRVIACSAAARAEGVRVGLREREAQARCTRLTMAAHDPETDERHFAPVLQALEGLVPGIEPLRPGLVALRARGPARYYGGETKAAVAIIDRFTALGFADTRIGIADGRFTAEQAARHPATTPPLDAPHPGVRLVPPGLAAAFLSPLPIARATTPELATVLHGLGIRTLGALGALPEAAVRERFGPHGVAARRRAIAAGPGHGHGSHTEVHSRDPVRDLSASIEFETPIEAAEPLAFACMTLAEDFITAITEEHLVCTTIRVSLTDDTGARLEREWAHPHRFTAADTVNRIRWQTASIGRDPERGGAGITHVRLTPVHTDRAAAHEPGLWSTEPDERVHHHLSRIQGRLGHTSVGTATLTGGRLLGERQAFVPWNTSAAPDHPGPWPGAAPPPSLVYPRPLPIELLDAAGAPVRIDDDDLLTTPPATLIAEGTRTPVQAWSPPWPLRERWWEGRPERTRLQVVCQNGDAWLLISSRGSWFAEGRYD